jgi:hypothetical protein
MNLPGERLWARAVGELVMASDGLEWEKLIDGLRLRGDPQVMAEAMRLLLAGVARASSDALVGDRRHPMFVPELNIAQNIFQPNADTIYKICLIEPGGSYLLSGDRGTTRMMCAPASTTRCWGRATSILWRSMATVASKSRSRPSASRATPAIGGGLSRVARS